METPLVGADESSWHANSYFAMDDHPLRPFLSTEMHGRKLPAIIAPMRAMQVITTLVEPEAEANEVRALLGAGVEGNDSERYLQGQIDDMQFIWERHGEFTSTMLLKPMSGEPKGSEVFNPCHFSGLPRDWFTRHQGRVVRAIQLAIIPDSRQDWVADIARQFVADDLVHCHLMDGRAGLWSDFRLKSTGYGQVLITDRGMTQAEAALCVQRVQELGNYRNLALLGLPMAQAMAGRLGELERRLTHECRNIGEGHVADNVLLAALANLSNDLTAISAESDYRMSATRAYAEMVEDRLRSLRVTRLPGQQTLGDFTERRLNPAVRTCASFTGRLERLARRTSEAGALLRTRLDTELGLQNRDLLQTMNRRNAVQLQLQQTVEGLSVVAISYYALSLISHVLEAIDLGPSFSSTRLIAFAVPVVVISVWLAIRRIHYRIGGHG